MRWLLSALAVVALSLPSESQSVERTQPLGDPAVADLMSGAAWHGILLAQQPPRKIFAPKRGNIGPALSPGRQPQRGVGPRFGATAPYRGGRPHWLGPPYPYPHHPPRFHPRRYRSSYFWYGVPTFSYLSGYYLPPVFYPPPVWYQPPLLPPLFVPQQILLGARIVANPPLPPVQVQLVNTARRELQATVIDLVDPNLNQTVRIQPGRSQFVSLQRDSGATQIRRYESVDAYGEASVREVSTEIPPAVRQQIEVHEWAVQSVAIDRTGKSPNPIEDINRQGRGLGRFPLPAGEQLQPGAIDIYRAALAADNPGAVAPLIGAEEHESSGLPPTDRASQLDRAILEAQRDALRRRRP